MKELPLYLLMISYERVDAPVDVINDYLAAEKPATQTRFLVVENSNIPMLEKQFKFSDYPDIFYIHFQNRNKAAAINYAVKELVEEKDALIIAIDNDIRFKRDYLIKYFKTAIKKGKQFYFGNSFSVILTGNVNKNLIPFLQGSAKGKTDADLKKKKSLMFLGFSYAFYKSQWKAVGGLDERFSPGSKYGLAAEESVFQKKLIHAGYIPFLVENNPVQHIPVPESYEEAWVIKRQENNGFTHGFQDLISGKDLRSRYHKKLYFYIKKTITFYKKRDNILLFRMTAAYTKGYIKAFFLFLRINNKKSFLKF